MTRYLCPPRTAVCAGVVLSALASGAAASEEAAGSQPPQRTLDQVRVRGVHIPDTKRNTSGISSLISREDFSIQGDSDAAGALRRVSGVSVGAGHFIYLRGLNERYSLATVNGARLPSPEPLRKAVPMDLFPTELIESIMVRKTYSPDVSAQLAGGSVDIATRSFGGGDSFFRLRLAGAYNDAASLNSAPTQLGLEPIDMTGLTPSVRAVPPDLGAALDNGSFGRLSLARRNELSRLAVDGKAPVLLTGQAQNDLDWAVRASFGRSLDSGGDTSVGVSGFAAYSSSRDVRRGVRGIGQASLTSDGPVTALSSFDTDQNTHRIRVDASLNGRIEFGETSAVRVVTLISRSTDILAAASTGFTNDDQALSRERLEWTGRQLWAAQLLGEHMPDLAALPIQARWRLTLARASRDAPYGVFNEYQTVDGRQYLRSGSHLSFSDIADSLTEAAMDLTVPLSLGDIRVDIDLGASYTTSERNSSSHVLVAQTIPAASRTLRVDHAYWTALNDPFWSFGTTQSARAPAFYRGTQTDLAGYLRLESEPMRGLRVGVGGRYESFTQTLSTSAGRLAAMLSTPDLQENQWYPSVSLAWTAFDDGQLRLGWSRTVTRPQFRELGPNRFTDPDTAEQYSGNPFLGSTSIENVDARFEYYFDVGQHVTLGAFHKDLQNPIETFYVRSGESRLMTFVNIDSAVVQGIEFELSRRITLGRLSSAPWFRQRDFRIRANLTLVRSSVTAESPVIFVGQSASARLADRVGRLNADTDISLQELTDAGIVDQRVIEFTPQRSLQGQSDILFNIQLGYFNAGTGENFNILLNYVSERIRAVESISDDSPAILEQLPLSLDLVWSRPIRIGDRRFRVSARAVNVLGGSYRAFQRSGGSEVDVVSYRSGRSLSVSMELLL